MKLLFKFVLLAVTLTAVHIGFIESKRHLTEDKQCSSDICNFGDNCILKCFCDTRLNLTDCLVFNGNLSSSSEIWNTFSPQTYLQTLSLRVTGTGSLKDIPTNTIQRLNTLRNLTIKFAPIKQLRYNAFASSMSLRGVYLIGNQLTKLDPYSISNMPNLVTLNLEENEISELQREVFVNLPSLKKLSLSYNNLTIIHERCFSDLTRLLELNLHANDISTLTRENFQGLNKLETLDLSRNELKMLGNYVFTEMRRLRNLILGENKLEMISEMALSGLVKLEHLSLEKNRIQFLEGRLFEGREFLSAVDLRYNRLQNLTHETVKPIVTNIVRLNKGFLRLEGNPFVCACSLSWALTINQNTISNQLRQSAANITCQPDLQLTRRLNNLTSTHQVHSRAYSDENHTSYSAVKEDNQIDDNMYHDEGSKDQVKVIEIPKELLCPRSLRKESSVDEPTTNEVRNNPSSSALTSKVSLMLVISMIYSLMV